MAFFQPFSIPSDLMVVRKRDLVANALGVSIAAGLLAKLTGNDQDYWLNKLAEEARKDCDSYSNEEVDELLAQAQQLRGQ